MEQCDVDQNDSDSGSSTTISDKSICDFSSSMGKSVCSTSTSSSSSNGFIGGSSTSSSLLSNGEESDSSNKDNNNINININQDDQYCTETRNWTECVPIGLRFCPWAITSKRQNRIKYISCLATDPLDVFDFIINEIKILCFEELSSSSSSSSPPLPLSTTLIICPFIEEWNNDFTVFDNFVKKFWKEQNRGEPKYGHHDVLQVPNNDNDNDNSRDDEINNERKELMLFFQQLQNQITLVSFHPKFARWRGLPYNIKVGSIVQCRQGMSGFIKSQEIYSAKILETSNSIFGQRRIKVQFLEHGREQQQQNNNDKSSNAADGKKKLFRMLKRK
jgi:hypothetical protein